MHGITGPIREVSPKRDGWPCAGVLRRALDGPRQPCVPNLDRSEPRADPDPGRGSSAGGFLASDCRQYRRRADRSRGAQGSMKIAIVTEDGHTVSQHFGRAPYYAVLTVEGGLIVARELRPKTGPHQTGGPREEHAGSGPHGTSPEAQSRHDQMAAGDRRLLGAHCGRHGAGRLRSVHRAGTAPGRDGGLERRRCGLGVCSRSAGQPGGAPRLTFRVAGGAAGPADPRTRGASPLTATPRGTSRR